MSFVNPGKYTHVSRGYAVIRDSDEKGHYNGKCKVTTNDTYGCPWEVPPLFEHRQRQVCIEFCNYVNTHGGTKTKLPVEFETKHFIFTGKVVGCSGYYTVTPMVGKGNKIPSVWGLIEIIHRKNERIANLKTDLELERFNTLKYKRMLLDYYKKVHEEKEDEIYWNIIKEVYDAPDIPQDIRHKLWEEAERQ